MYRLHGSAPILYAVIILGDHFPRRNQPASPATPTNPSSFSPWSVKFLQQIPWPAMNQLCYIQDGSGKAPGTKWRRTARASRPRGLQGLACRLTRTWYSSSAVVSVARYPPPRLTRGRRARPAAARSYTPPPPAPSPLSHPQSRKNNRKCYAGSVAATVGGVPLDTSLSA